MSLLASLEKISTRYIAPRRIEGSLEMPARVFDYFLDAPYDMLPQFQGPPGSKLKGGRGKDHPRYGRFVYAFAKALQPDVIVEVGTYAGGTAIGWATALKENGKGRLICVDYDVYSKGTFPEITRKNILHTGLPENRFELQSGNSKVILPQLRSTYPAGADIVLIDGDHTYEGALGDLENALPLIKKGGYLLVHDVDKNRRMDEMTSDHPAPVYEAFHEIARRTGHPWCILTFIRKHLGVMRISL